MSGLAPFSRIAAGGLHSARTLNNMSPTAKLLSRKRKTPPRERAIVEGTRAACLHTVDQELPIVL